MCRPRLEVADIFDRHGAAWRRANAGHVSLGQLQVMSAIVSCRTAALGGHVTRCEACAHTQIADNSCRNRHCPKCQGAAARDWLAEREADLLPVPYFHVVFTLPAAIADLAYQNKAVIYDALFKASSEALLTIAADPKHRRPDRRHRRAPQLGLGHDPSSARPWDRSGRRDLTGRLELGALQARLPPARAWLSKLFRRLMLEKLEAAHAAGKLRFFGQHARLADADAFAAFLAPLRTTRWFVYAKRPFAGPQAVLAYLSRYTHRVAIANSRLIAADDDGVTFTWKDYRFEGRDRHKSMTLAPDEFIRRFLLHILPKGFHRIRHYGLLASAARRANIARARSCSPHPSRQRRPTRRPRPPPRRQPTIARHARAAAGA